MERNFKTRSASVKTWRARWRSLNFSARTGKVDVKRSFSSGTEREMTDAISSRV